MKWNDIELEIGDNVLLVSNVRVQVGKLRI